MVILCRCILKMDHHCVWYEPLTFTITFVLKSNTNLVAGKFTGAETAVSAASLHVVHFIDEVSPRSQLYWLY